MNFIKKMNEYRGQEIVVVMSDSRAIRGILEEVTSDMLILSSPMETDNREIEWVEEGDTKKGYSLWRKVNMPEVVIKVDGILRVWPYKLTPETEKAETGDEGEKKVRNAIAAMGEFSLMNL